MESQPISGALVAALGVEGSWSEENQGVLTCTSMCIVASTRREGFTLMHVHENKNTFLSRHSEPEVLNSYSHTTCTNNQADDSHFGDRFGRTVVLHGTHLIAGENCAACMCAGMFL